MSLRKPQIFVSHSQHDKDIRASFDTIFARTGVKSVCMEFEKVTLPAWQEIKDVINASETVFLLLGPRIRKSIYTQNWIAFEVGLSCALGKRVWVFEQMHSKIDFPIPFFTDYLLYSLDDNIHFGYVKAIIEGYGDSPKKKIPIGLLTECRHCHLVFYMHQTIGAYYCPSCRQPSWHKKR
jgi:hypothetical protein